MKPKGTQFHPSRDVGNKPPEYELPYGGNKGVNLVPGGYYEDEAELAGAKRFWTDEGALEHPDVMEQARAHFEPAQGRLFDAEKHEAANRQKLGRERLNVTESGLANGAAAQIRNEALQRSTIPTSHLQSRRVGQETTLTTGNDDRSWVNTGMAGWYRGPATTETPDTVAIDPSGPHKSDTVVHELGHRHHLGERTAYDEEVSHPRQRHPDPLKEGVADAYVDRFGGLNSRQVRPMAEDVAEGRGQTFTSYNFTGYSANKQAGARYGWDPADRAVYAATRAHASETGENASYVPQGRHVMEKQQNVVWGGGGDPTIDATLHHLLSTSPHAAQALRQTGLKDVGAEAFRRHRDRQLLHQGQEVQGSLFMELQGHTSGKVHGYTPAPDTMDLSSGDYDKSFEGFHGDIDAAEAKHGEYVIPRHMSVNQFGEKPRLSSEVGGTLGVTRFHAEQRGFT